MTKKKKEISVFLASPGDLAPERQVFKSTIDKINEGFGAGANVKFNGYGWEDEYATTGRRVQSVINLEVDKCDVFILTLHRRWGQQVKDSKYSSYTEEEFYRAYDRWKKSQQPEILVFLKNVDDASLADPGEQLKKVVTFKRDLEKGDDVLIRNFSTETDFGKEIESHLRAFSQGRWDKLDNISKPVVLPNNEIRALQRSEQKNKKKLVSTMSHSARIKGKSSKLKPDLTMVLAEQEALTFTRAAIEALNQGRVQDASTLFAKATQGTTNLSILSIAIDFYTQVGNRENANNLVRRQSAIANDRSIAAKQYLTLLPDGYFESLQDQILNQMLQKIPDHEKEMILNIQNELTKREIGKKYLLDSMIRHFSTAEIMSMSQLLSTAEGQSALQKQGGLLMESMLFGEYAFKRMLYEMNQLDFDGEANDDFDRVLELPSR
jgi:hypothetical protein